MSKKKIENLQATIKSKGYNWTSGTTSVSELSVEQFKAKLGLIVDKAELAATAKAIEATTKLQAFVALIALPTAVDWRNKNGADWTTPIKDQGQCGACVAFGTVATIESRIKIVCEKSSLNKDLSEAHLLFCGGGSCSGWSFPSALNFAQTTGVGEESCFPYPAKNTPCKPCPPYVKLTSWSQVLTVADRKNILATKGPMVGGMAVYQDFSSYTRGVYKHVSGALRGYHCIMIAGYDDTQQCWICKNSWGTNWGDHGWFKIGYGECQIDTNIAFYDINLNCPN
jgi:C1A family cysteine protease